MLRKFFLIKKSIKLVLISLAVTNSVAFAITPFKHFSDYVDIQSTSMSNPSIFRAHYFAKQKINDRNPDPLYKNNQWKLVQRRGIYLAQVDKTMSEMYKYFLGYSTDVDLVEEKGDYFVARRQFKHFQKAFDKGQYLIKLNGATFTIKDYTLSEDGRLIKENEVKRLRGLASIAVLTRFFNETDAEDFNYGFQESDNEIKAIFYDCEHALDFWKEQNQTDIEKDLIEKFGDKLVSMPWYQQEKQQMLQKIAVTDFAIIEHIIRQNITSSKLDEARWMYNKILNDPTVWPEFDRNEARKKLEELNKLDEKEYGVDKIITQLRVKHEQLRKQIMK